MELNEYIFNFYPCQMHVLMIQKTTKNKRDCQPAKLAINWGLFAADLHVNALH